MKRMKNRFTLGFLGSHSWSFAGSDNTADINKTYLQHWWRYLVLVRFH